MFPKLLREKLRKEKEPVFIMQTRTTPNPLQPQANEREQGLDTEHQHKELRNQNDTDQEHRLRSQILCEDIQGTSEKSTANESDETRESRSEGEGDDEDENTPSQELIDYAVYFGISVENAAMLEERGNVAREWRRKTPATERVRWL